MICTLFVIIFTYSESRQYNDEIYEPFIVIDLYLELMAVCILEYCIEIYWLYWIDVGDSSWLNQYLDALSIKVKGIS
jgi:hypothetical protein